MSSKVVSVRAVAPRVRAQWYNQRSLDNGQHTERGSCANAASRRNVGWSLSVSLTSLQSGEGEIRRALVEADMVDCMVALPSQLFYTTQIPVCLWFLTRSKANGKFRDRRRQTLFIDARKLGTLFDRTHRELSEASI
jgi:type I restriction-modification system DNA methylase subunit